MTNLAVLTAGQELLLWHEVYAAGVETQRAMGLPEAPAWMLDSVEDATEITEEQLLELGLWGKACEAWEDARLEATMFPAPQRRCYWEEDWGDVVDGADEAELLAILGEAF